MLFSRNARCFFLVLIFFFSFRVFACAQTSHKDKFFTVEEAAWLRAHPQWRIGVDPAWPPVEMVQDGIYIGMGADYARLLEKRLGVNMRLVPGLSWPEVLEKARLGELDVLPMPVKSPEREAYLNFTQVLVSLPTVIITRSDRGDISGIDELAEKKVSVAESYAVHEWLKENYPKITLRPYPDVERSLQAVAFGEVDAYIGDLASTTYAINRLGLVNLKVSGNTPYTELICMGVRKDWPELIPILNKAIAGISSRERAKIRDKWIVLRRRFGAKEILAVALPAIICAVFLTLFGVNWRLRREIKQRKSAQEELKKAHDGLEEQVRLRTAELDQRNDALRESEVNYRTLVEDANSIIMRMDVRGRVTFFNEFAQRFFGYSGKEILGQNVVGTIVPPADAAGHNLRVMINDIMANSDKYVNNENENMRRNGQRVWIAWTNRPILDEAGRL
ncbi:MAG: transporter substrate-binding domain-containing protein, partial [Candidatus Omnitrophota bacterium]|nr:transporter substrate-binding domain-containing protein [Candidatus Omnitrophota bacterium]